MEQSGKPCESSSDRFFRSQLVWIYSVFKEIINPRVYIHKAIQKEQNMSPGLLMGGEERQNLYETHFIFFVVPILTFILKDSKIVL